VGRARRTDTCMDRKDVAERRSAAERSPKHSLPRRCKRECTFTDSRRKNTHHSRRCCNPPPPPLSRPTAANPPSLLLPLPVSLLYTLPSAERQRAARSGSAWRRAAQRARAGTRSREPAAPARVGINFHDRIKFHDHAHKKRQAPPSSGRETAACCVRGGPGRAGPAPARWPTPRTFPRGVAWKDTQRRPSAPERCASPPARRPRGAAPRPARRGAASRRGSPPRRPPRGARARPTESARARRRLPRSPRPASARRAAAPGAPRRP
jgi:hypothetical protein